MTVARTTWGLAELALAREIENFLFEEADLLDERRFGSGVVHLHYRTGT